MCSQIPLDTIHQLQISLRDGANIPSYDPSGPSFPELPPLEHLISQLDPSPPYLRCKHCKGRLLRGIKSLFCVFCGKEQFGDIQPDPINFRSTGGYRWLLDSLQLDGSEVVELISEATDVIRRQSTPKNEMRLSDLLNLDIQWHAKIEIPESTTIKALPQTKSSLNLSGVDLDNFFSEGKEEVTLDESEEQLLRNVSHAGESVAFQGREDLSLFENVQPSTTPTKSKEHEIGTSQSSWAANFQSAGSGAIDKDSRSLESFAGSQANISTHMDMVFGSGNAKSGSTVSSYSNADDWFQDNPRSNSNPTSSFMDPTNSSSVNADDRLDNLWQRGSEIFNQSVSVGKKDDSLDAWDDFTTSKGQRDPPNSSSREEPIGTNCFSLAGDGGENDFGAFQQPDLSSGAFNSLSGSNNEHEVQPEASTLNRTFPTDEKDWNKAEAAKGEGTPSAANSKIDVEMIMSQMHDLSFMLDSNLSIPRRYSFSKDRI